MNTNIKLTQLPACFSRASANLWPGIGMSGLGADLMEHAGPPRALEGGYEMRPNEVLMNSPTCI